MATQEFTARFTEVAEKIAAGNRLSRVFLGVVLRMASIGPKPKANEDEHFRVYTGWVERRKGGSGFVVVQPGGLYSLEGAMEEAKSVEGWVEADGILAHLRTLHPIKK